MALTVETGEGVQGADAYESAADTLARLTAKGMQAFASFPLVRREQIIRTETASVDSFLQAYQTGRRESDEQGLLFPRVDTFFADRRRIERNTIPDDLKEGLALRVESFSERQCPAGESQDEPDSFREQSGRGFVHLERFLDRGP